MLYGLGAIRQDLPAYVVLSDPGVLPVDGVFNWSSGYLPAVCQGTPMPFTTVYVKYAFSPIPGASAIG